MKTYTKLILLSLIGFFSILSCRKNNNEIIACTYEMKYPSINFKVVNAQTGEDLFFSNTPKYTTSQICFFKTSDKLRKDTIKPHVNGSGISRFFSMTLNYPAQKDTLILKMPATAENLNEDLFIYTVKNGNDFCLSPILNKGYLNNTELKFNADKLIFKMN